ncbi:41458_t:CDS:2, partial [Gigaspora margarita]
IWKLDVALLQLELRLHSILLSPQLIMQALDYIWSIVTGNGTISVFIAIYYRLTIPESQHYRIFNVVSINLLPINLLQTCPLHEVWQMPTREEEVIVKVNAPKPNITFYGIGFNKNITLQSIGFFGDGKDPY